MVPRDDPSHISCSIDQPQVADSLVLRVVIVGAWEELVDAPDGKREVDEAWQQKWASSVIARASTLAIAG